MPTAPSIVERAEQPSVAVRRWGCRLEVYKTDPAEQPDTGKWETELLFRLAD